MLAEQYITTVANDLKGIISQLDRVKDAAAHIFGAVTAGQSVFVIDQYNILDAEMVNRAGGLALFTSLRNELADPSTGDVYVISAYHPDDPVDMGFLTEAREIGAAVIAIAPPGALADEADTALLNTYDPHNGILEAPGVGEPFCPASGIFNTTLAWMMAADVCERLLADDRTPSVFMNESLKGGDDFNEATRRDYTQKGF